jgi:hypothetical protein
MVLNMTSVMLKLAGLAGRVLEELMCGVSCPCAPEEWLPPQAASRRAAVTAAGRARVRESFKALPYCRRRPMDVDTAGVLSAETTYVRKMHSLDNDGARYAKGGARAGCAAFSATAEERFDVSRRR